MAKPIQDLEVLDETGTAVAPYYGYSFQRRGSSNSSGAGTTRYDRQRTTRKIRWGEVG
jgi:hypothetical protein